MNIAEQETGGLGIAEDQQQDDLQVDQGQNDGQEKTEEEVELEEISIAGAESQAAEEAEHETPAIRRIREAQREEARKRKEAERTLAEYEAREKQKPQVEPAPKLGPKPTMEQFDYDSEKYEEETAKWYEQKQAVAAHEAKQRAARETAEQEHKRVVETYRANAAALPVDRARFQAAEAEVVSSFDTLQQNILLKSKSPERLVFAIGNNPAKLDELAKIKDPIALAYELGRVESTLVVTKQKKSAPAPDRPLQGGGGGAVDSTLARLEAEADRTGDRSKLLQYRLQQKQAKK